MTDGLTDRPLVTDPNVLWDGPLFADEIGWTSGLSDDLIERYDLDARRIVLGKQANKGVRSIYFRPPHLGRALIRYAHRYRGLIELLLRQGLSGERRLMQQGWQPADIDYFFEIIPDIQDSSHNPVVYQLVLRSLTVPHYLDIARALATTEEFTPKRLLRQADGCDADDFGHLLPFVRHHLIERVDNNSPSKMDRTKHHGTRLQIVPDAHYEVTPEGSSAIPAICSVHTQLIVEEAFEPLAASVEEATSHLIGLQPESSTPETNIVNELMSDLATDHHNS